MDFAARLDLVLKGLSISRGRLASDAGVDKSLVSRWLSGAVKPSPHNLERITRLVARHCPGFSMLDWEAEPGAFVARLSLVAPGMATVTGEVLPVGRACHPGRLPFGSLSAAATETARRQSAYVGRWLVTRLSLSGHYRLLREGVLIMPDGDGLSIEHHFDSHWLKGWLLVSNNTLYGFVADSGDDSFAYYCLNGVVGPRALRLDGVHTSVSGQRATVPAATIIVLDHVGELAGEAADRAWAQAQFTEIAADSVAPDILAAVTRDYGPMALARGGEAVLRVPADRSLTSGGY
jgi:hypothetical protein